jgi:hypothetical protein
MERFLHFAYFNRDLCLRLHEGLRNEIALVIDFETHGVHFAIQTNLREMLRPVRASAL